MAVEYTREGSVGYITLDNPPANSYDLSFMEELSECVRSAAEDEGTGAVILRSGSERFFSAGADIKAFDANSVEDNMRMISQAHEGLSEIARTPKVFIAHIGVSKALDLMVTGRTISPSEAHEVGILDRLFPADALEVETRKYAEKLAGGATEAIGSIKLAVYGGIERPLDEGLETERTLVEPLFESEDAREGISAFMEKRKPEFSK